MLKFMIKEYGLIWVFNRFLYSLKIFMLRSIPYSERIFEKYVDIERVDIFNFDVNNIEVFLKRLTNEKKNKIISIANNAIDGKILGFSSIELDYGKPMKWNYNPLTKKEVKQDLKWFHIPDFDSTRGDIKIIWEISRFTHFFYFARAYMLTKDEKYYIFFSEHLRNWLKNNPYSYGPNYKCGQEAAIRMINALMVYQVFNAYHLINKDDEINIKTLIKHSYKKLMSNFFYAHKCIKNNHTLSEIIGLIIGAWCCNDEKRLAKAYQLLDKEIDNQFFNDGGYIQYSFNYQRVALQLIECVLKISQMTKVNISRHSKKLIRESVMLMYQMQTQNGDVPNYGYNDGALIFPVTSCGYRDFRPFLNSIWILLDGNRLYDPGDYDEEVLWFGERSIVNILKSNMKRVSSAFIASGYYSIRNDNGFLMIIHQNYKTRPAHMDQLHLDLWYKDRNIFCDCGTYSYTSKIGKEMVLTKAHNTVNIIGRDQMNIREPFMVYGWSCGRNAVHKSDRFCGTMISKNKYKHNRSIIKNLSSYIVNDVVIGDVECLEVRFHTPYIVKINVEGFEIYDYDKLLCRVYITGEISVEKAYRSLYYLRKEEINCVVVRYRTFNSRSEVTYEIKLID